MYILKCMYSVHNVENKCCIILNQNATWLIIIGENIYPNINKRLTAVIELMACVGISGIN